MTVYDNGVYRDATPDEIQAMEEAQANLPKPQPTDSQRIADLEARLAAYENAYEEGVNNA